MMMLNPSPTGRLKHAGYSPTSYAGACPSEIPIANMGGLALVGFTGTHPLRRAASLDQARYQRLRSLLSVNPDAAKALQDYLPASGHSLPGTRSAGPKLVPASFGAPMNSLNSLARHAATLLSHGLIGLRGTSAEAGIVLPFASGAPRRTSEAGKTFLYHKEARKNVSNRLHHPSDTSGVTLGPGYDMRGRDYESVLAELISIGVERKAAELVAKEAPGRLGPRAQSFVDDHRDLIILTEVQERSLLTSLLSKYEKGVCSALNSAIQQRLFAHEFDALVSFAYNVGHLAGTSVASALNKGDFVTATTNFMQFTRSGKDRHLLDSRRHSEVRIFERGLYA